jgi:eukaryotic-like serine/threonine-protein kinase
MPTPPPHIDRATFLANLRQSRLLSAEQWEKVLPRLPDSRRGRVLARALVERGLLTRFQAERLLAGRTAGFFLGQYRILEEIGRGGMGRVYKAEHRTMGRVVALKVLAPHLLSNPRAVELFQHEVRAAAQLVHPNIVTAYDANRSGGRYYLVLEYVDGPNLGQMVRKRGPLSVGLACDYVRQAALGLQHAHNLGMLHRDIKPANLLVQRRGLAPGESGLLKVSDFGLARLTEPADKESRSRRPDTLFTRQNTVMGTPDFLSPEQARSLHKTDSRSDLYSLGCTFYYLLTGEVPFPGGNALDKLLRHSTEKAPPVTDLRPETPAPVAAVIARLMAKHPDERFRTPAELAQALHPYAVSGPSPWGPARVAPGPAPDAPSDEEVEALPEDSDPNLTASSDELAALVNTEAGVGSTTDMTGDVPRPTDRPDKTSRRLLFAALAVAFSVAGLLVGTAAAVAIWLLWSWLHR